MTETEYMELPCKYCLKVKLFAIKCNEYPNGKVVVSCYCENCNRKQKYSNNPIKFKIKNKCVKDGGKVTNG